MTKSPPASPGGTLRFSTDAFAERERVTAWRETIRHIVKLDVEPLPGIPFYAHANIRIMPDLAIVSGSGALRKSGRTRDLLADGNDTVILQITTCDGLVSQPGGEVPVAAGDAIVLSNADVSNFTFQSEQSTLGLALPRSLLAPFLHDPDTVFTRTIPKDNGAMRLLKAYVAILEREPALAGEDLQRLAASHVHDLVALALGATPDAAEIARTRGVRAARLHVARTFVMQHIGWDSLSAASVAAHLGVTPRYVHMLFEAAGPSFSEFVLAERLARAHRMLNAPRHAADTISAIAYAVGFGDLSHFNRSFRRRYGCTPSDVRDASRRERDGNGPG